VRRTTAVSGHVRRMRRSSLEPVHPGILTSTRRSRSAPSEQAQGVVAARRGGAAGRDAPAVPSSARRTRPRRPPEAVSAHPSQSPPGWPPGPGLELRPSLSLRIVGLHRNHSVNAVPRAAELSTLIRPPRFRMISWQIASPTPSAGLPGLGREERLEDARQVPSPMPGRCPRLDLDPTLGRPHRESHLAALVQGVEALLIRLRKTCCICDRFDRSAHLAAKSGTRAPARPRSPSPRS